MLPLNFIQSAVGADRFLDPLAQKRRKRAVTPLLICCRVGQFLLGQVINDGGRIDEGRPVKAFDLKILQYDDDLAGLTKGRRIGIYVEEPAALLIIYLT